MGGLTQNWDWDQQAAVESFQKAIELNPSDAEIHNHLSNFYLRIGDCNGAETESRISNALQSMDYDPKLDFQLLLCRRDLQQISKMNPDDYLPFGFQYSLLMFQGKYQKVIKLINDGAIKYHPFRTTWLGEAYAFSGDSVTALKVVEELKDLSKTQYVPFSQIAPIYMALGDHEMAFQLLEEAVKNREFQIHVLPLLFVSTYRIQDDPRYVRIKERSWIPHT
jgi:Flp pilus assembly protein TadD